MELRECGSLVQFYPGVVLGIVFIENDEFGLISTENWLNSRIFRIVLFSIARVLKPILV